MNFLGILVGLATFFLLGIGFVWVIWGERYLGYWWWPYFMGMGLLLIASSLFIQNDWASAVVGVLGSTLVWGSTELKEQAIRTELGWFPFNAQKLKPPFAAQIAKIKPPHL